MTGVQTCALPILVKNSGDTVLLASMLMAFRLHEAHRNIQAQRMDIEAAYEEMQVANEELLQTQHKIDEQLDELRRWHSVTLGREGRILELKAEINHLLQLQGLPPRYPSATRLATSGQDGAEAGHE